MRISIPAVVIAGLWSSVALAQTDTNSGNYIMRGCRVYIETAKSDTTLVDAALAGQCLGVVTTLLYVGSSLPESLRFCPPKEVTRQQAVRVALTYADAHPEILHKDFRLIASAALQKAWPCR